MGDDTHDTDNAPPIEGNGDLMTDLQSKVNNLLAQLGGGPSAAPVADSSASDKGDGHRLKDASVSDVVRSTVLSSGSEDLWDSSLDSSGSEDSVTVRRSRGSSGNSRKHVKGKSRDKSGGSRDRKGHKSSRRDREKRRSSKSRSRDRRRERTRESRVRSTPHDSQDGLVSLRARQAAFWAKKAAEDPEREERERLRLQRVAELKAAREKERAEASGSHAPMVPAHPMHAMQSMHAMPGAHAMHAAQAMHMPWMGFRP